MQGVCILLESWPSQSEPTPLLCCLFLPECDQSCWVDLPKDTQRFQQTADASCCVYLPGEDAPCRAYLPEVRSCRVYLLDSVNHDTKAGEQDQLATLLEEDLNILSDSDGDNIPSPTVASIIVVPSKTDLQVCLSLSSPPLPTHATGTPPTLHRLPMPGSRWDDMLAPSRRRKTCPKIGK